MAGVSDSTTGVLCSLNMLWSTALVYIVSCTATICLIYRSCGIHISLREELESDLDFAW